MRPRTSSLLVFLVFAASTLCFGANTWTVTSIADDGSVGTLRWAISQSQSGDTILFNLTYPATIALANFDLVISHSLTITGPGSAKLTIDSTNNHNGYRAFSVTSGTVSISGLTVTGGRGKASDSTTDGEGGAIYNTATLSLTDVTVSNNRVGAQGNGGGGIYNTGTLTLTDCTITGNQAGATTLQFDQSNQPILVRGGGIRDHGSLTVTNSTISNNFAHEGGGIWSNGSQFSVSGSTFSGNQAGVGVSTTLNLEGGGIYFKSTQANSAVINSTFVNNQGKIYGGAMTIWPGGQFSVSVSDSTFSGNTAHGGGGPGGAFSVENGTLILKNNLLYDPDECYFGSGALTSLGYNLASDSSCGLTSAGDQQSKAAGLDPASLQNNGGPTQTVALLSTSPAVDAGSCTDAADNTVSTDQRGVTRPQGAACDIGAFELEQSSTTTVTNTKDSGSGSLRDAISNAPDGGTVDFNLTYPATITLTSGELIITKNLTIRGPGATNLAISGGSSSSCIINPNGTKDCTPPTGGSQIFDIVSGVTDSITGVTLENGNNDNGGAVINSGTLTLSDCVVTQNQSIQGAALNNQSTGTLALRNCTVSNNTASGIGGGLINFGTATVTASTFSGNSALEAAGALNGGTLTIVNSTFANNQATSAEGAIGNDSILHISNSTFYNNSAGSAGLPGALYNFSGGTSTLKGTLIAKGSLGADCGSSTGSIVSEGYNLADDSSCSSFFADPTDQNNVTAAVNPNGLQDNGGPTETVALLANSTAVDAIPVASCADVDGNPLTTDQRGVSRPQGNGCDIGAFELKLIATTTALTSSSSPSTYGANVNFTATVVSQSGSGTPTGTVTFYDSTTPLGTISLSSGQAVLSISTLSGGGHTITANYSGDANFASSTSAPVNQTVNPASTSAMLSSSVNPSNYGDSVSFTATVSSTVSGTQTGTVTFYDGTTSLGSMPLSSGQAVLSTSSLSGGQHSVTATYNGDANFGSSTSTAVMQSVNRASTSTMVTSATNPSIYGQPVAFTATLSSTAGTPTGSVLFFDGLFHAISGSIPLVNGQATFTNIFPPLAVGSHTIYAEYGGDTNFANSLSSGLSQNVSKASTTTSLNASPNPATTSQTITLSASVQTQYGVPQGGGSASGTVTFMDGQNKVLGTATLLNGSTALQITLGQGSHNLTAVYGGDSNNTGSASPVVTETVTAPLPTTITVTSSLNPSYVGQAVTFTAAVTPSQATGTVTFMQGQNTLGTAVLNAGKASFSTSAMPAGNLLIVAVYGGDGQYAGSTSPSLSQTVNKGSTAISILSFPNPSIIGQPVTFVAHVTVTSSNGGTPTGTVTFVRGSTVMGSASLDSTGTAKISSSSLSLGNNNVKAVYGGSPAYLGSTSAAITQVVNF